MRDQIFLGGKPGTVFFDPSSQSVPSRIGILTALFTNHADGWELDGLSTSLRFRRLKFLDCGNLEEFLREASL